MKLKGLLLAVLACCAIAVPAAAQTFINTDGTFTSTGNTTGTLSLSGSTLTQVTGLTAYGISNTPESDLGSVSFTTGSISTGAIDDTTIGGQTTFSAGGSFTIKYQNGTIFSGSFGTPTTWTYLGNGQYSFVGVVNGTLSVPGYNPVMVMGASVQLTTASNGLTASGSGYTVKDSGGSTSFGLPAGGLTPVPEPGTLTLLGTGLVSLGVFVRRLRTGENRREVES